MNLRNEARGRACMGRYPGVCNFDTSTTVLAHLRLAGITGGAQKAPDQLGAWLCSASHDETDRRTRKLESDFVKTMFYEAIFRTQYELIKEGAIK